MHNRQDNRTTVNAHRRSSGSSPNTPLTQGGVYSSASPASSSSSESVLYTGSASNGSDFYTASVGSSSDFQTAQESKSNNDDEHATPYLPKPTTCSRCKKMTCGLVNGEYEISAVCQAAFAAEEATLLVYVRRDQQQQQQQQQQ